MQPTYNPTTPATQANPWQLGPTASKIARWVFGLGFFSVHLGIFLIGGLALLMINLYRSPDDLWVGGPLLRWGIVVVIHGLGAIVTWAITTAIDAAEATRMSATQYPPPRPVQMLPQQPPVVPRIVEPSAPPRPRFQPGISTPITAQQASDPRGGGRNWRGEQAEPAAHRASPPGWSVVRPADPAPSPAPAPQPKVAAAPSQTPPSWAIPASAKSPAQATPVTPSTEDDDPTGSDDNRWTWVEAAAEAWLAKQQDGAADKRDDSRDKDS